jgi:hypothetical protein
MAAEITASANVVKPGAVGLSLDPYELDERMARALVARVLAGLNRARGNNFATISWASDTAPRDPALFLKHEADKVGRDIAAILPPVVPPVTELKEISNVE